MRLGTALKYLRPAAFQRNIKMAYGAVVYEFKFRSLPRLLAKIRGRRLKHEQGRVSLTGKPIVAVAPYYGNEDLLSYFLAHHRQIGVDFFVFLDLSPRASLASLLRDAKDTAVWRPPASGPLKAAPHWLNSLRRRYAVGRWCLSLEPTEFFVFPRYESRHLRDLVELLELEGRDHLYALVIDTYGDGASASDPGEETSTPSSSDPMHPFRRLPYFDAVGYIAQPMPRFRGVMTGGGIQRRTVFQAEPRRSPALNRIPLVKWGEKFCYVAGTRIITPRHLNTAHARWHLSPTGCLLRFTLIDEPESLAIAAKLETFVIARDGTAPGYPGLARLRGQDLRHEGSVRYRTSQDLMDWGLMMPGQWF